MFIVAIRKGNFSLNVVVGHAPRSVSGKDHSRKWWNDASSQFSGLLDSSIPELLLLDANARVGSVVSEAIGAVQAEPQNYPGGVFHNVLRDRQLWPPSTFFQSDGAGVTWHSPNDQRSEK
eukprot:5170173-Pyramimonas_sp.AAC.2